MHWSVRAVTSLLLPALIACGGDEPKVCGGDEGVQVRFDPSLPREGSEAERWLAFPFPSDHRRQSDGLTRWADFPNPTESELVEKYVVLADEVLGGFSTNAAVHLAFDGPLDPARLPPAPGAYRTPSSLLQLVDVTEGSPEYGTRRPLRWAWTAEAGQFVPDNALAVAPEWGFPLRSGTTYALLVLRGVRDADGRELASPETLQWLLGNDVCGAGNATDELRAQYAPVRALLARDGIAADRVAAATVFTTGEVTAELHAIREQIHAAPPPPLVPDGWQPIGPDGLSYAREATYRWNSQDEVRFLIFEGRFTAPNYQIGEVPYLDAGGGFQLVDGVPQKVRDEDLRFVLTVPRRGPDDGGACYPIVQYAHGTGGDAYGFTWRTAGRLAGRGLAAIGIDMPIHGPRGLGRDFQVDLMSFNFMNLASARTIQRQAAIDTFALTRFVRESLKVPADVSPTGREICFDPERVTFFGHSQGGISGSLAAAAEEDLDAWVVSGSGGGVSVTVMRRKDIVDVADMVRILSGLEEGDEPLSDLHPILTLAQSLTDVTDPVNYAPLWGTRRNALLTSGTEDEATNWRTANAQAVAGRIPLVEPVAVPIPGYALADLSPVTAPVRATESSPAAGYLQWQGEDHFVIFNRAEAINASMRFLQSASYEGAGPVIERDPDADVQ